METRVKRVAIAMGLAVVGAVVTVPTFVRAASPACDPGYGGLALPSGFCADPLINPGDAVARANGVAQAPDGSLYIAESQKGRVWRVMYKDVK